MSVDGFALVYARGILALPVSEVENLYYSDAVMMAVAANQAATLDETVDALISHAWAAALKALGEHRRQSVSPPISL